MTVFLALLACLLASAARAVPPQAFLKVNQFYILYTSPIVPQSTKSGDFLVGLQSAALILNAKAVTNAQATVTTVVKGPYKIQFTAGSPMALVDGKPVRLAAPAVLKQPSGQMVVPMSSLINSLHLQARWDVRRRVLALTGKNLLNNINSDFLRDYAGLEQPYRSPTPLIPFSADFGGPHKEARHRLIFKAQNASSRTLKQGSSYINMVNAGELPAHMTPPYGPYSLNYVEGGPPWLPDLATYSPQSNRAQPGLSTSASAAPNRPRQSTSPSG